MKTLIISYSFTGNNEKIAKKIAKILGAELCVLEEMKNRNVFTIVLDVLFNRTPLIKEIEKNLGHYENLIFVAPVWFGKIATPLRQLLKELKGKNENYSLVTLSAGADGNKNPNLEKELIKRTGLAPKSVINPLISEILPANPKPSRLQLDAYRVPDTVAEGIAEKVVSMLN